MKFIPKQLTEKPSQVNRQVVNEDGRPGTNRRWFLKTAAPFALGLFTVARAQIPIERGRFNEADIPLARQQLLEMVNTERSKAGLNRLQLDDLACKVASEHALDMAKAEFLNHWGTDGLKPYQRFSFAGGTDAVQENVSSADQISSLTSTGVLRDLHDMHQSMIDEVPPNNGHRKTILYPWHTHVGFGIAMQGRNVRLDELYLSRYVTIDPLPREARTGTTVIFRGRLNMSHYLNGVEVFYEPPPSPPDIAWLREPRSYGMPAPTDKLLPQLPDRLSYPDGSNGSIEIDSTNRFRVRVRLAKRPGINTLMVWIKIGSPGVAFPAAQVCIRVVS
jgi:uncharacterized protein YkwD